MVNNMLFNSSDEIQWFATYTAKTVFNELSKLQTTEPNLDEVIDEVIENWYPYYYELDEELSHERTV